MNYKQLKKDRDRWERMYKVAKEMREHYEDLFTTALSELKFANLQTAHLKSVLDEIVVLSKEEIVKAVIENSLNRAELDKLIHIKEVFPNPEGFNEKEKKES